MNPIENVTRTGARAGVILLFGLQLVTSGCHTYYGGGPEYPALPTSTDKKAKGLTPYTPKSDSSASGLYYQAQTLASPSETLIGRAAAAESAAPEDRAEKIRAFVDAGITYSDILFDRLFDSFKTLQDNVRYDQNLLNILTGGAVGILGLTGTDAKALGIIGVTQSTLNSDFQNYAAIYLLTPSLGQLHSKVMGVREQLATTLLQQAQSGSMTFDEARRKLNNYHNTGSLLSLQEYIRLSVDIAKFTAIDPGALAKETESKSLLLQLRKSLDLGPQLDADGAFAVYLIMHDNANVTKLLGWAASSDKNEVAQLQNGDLTALAAWLKKLNDGGVDKKLADSLDSLGILGQLETTLGLSDRRVTLDQKITDITKALAAGTPVKSAESAPTPATPVKPAAVQAMRVWVVPPQ